MEDRITDKQAGFLKKSGLKMREQEIMAMSKQEASKLIDEIINKPKMNGKVLKEPQVEFTERFGKDFSGGWIRTPIRNAGSQGPMWGRYATDLVIAMIENKGDNPKFDVVEAATTSIQIVLSMRNQFKE